jgi:hypothetical protein
MYSVWVFTRPLYYTNLFPPLDTRSKGSDYLRHWGVLVTELSILDMKILFQRTRSSEEAGTAVGTLYELIRVEGGSTINILQPINITILRRDWRALSGQYIGTTHMTHAMIGLEGNSRSIFG